ncbi:MAG: DUF1801 domain-containing protein [Flavobacteriaceae bacterium]|nr:DUF1801 domain-containing protein [Flavobacteriaceae bacterium]
MNPAEVYILEKPEPFKSILLQLQVLIENTLPTFLLLYKWKLPFYFVEKCPICYLNVTKGYVDVCFWLSNDFAFAHPALISEKRKRVKSLRYYSMEDIDSEVLISCLQEAYRTREEGFKVR